MKKGFMVLACAVFLMGCQPTDSQMEKNGQEALRQHLKDPDSGKFRNVYFVRGDKTSGLSKEGFVCGEVNAKNAFGAYVGFSRFSIHVSADTRFLIPYLGIAHGESGARMVNEEASQSELGILSKEFNSRCVR